jgi:hypothetical protein
MHRRRGPARALLFRREDRPTGLEGFYGERAWPIVLGSHPLHGLDDFYVFALAELVFRRLFQADDGDSEDGHYEYEGAACVPDVSPTHVVGVRAHFRVVGAGEVCCVKSVKSFGFSVVDKRTHESPRD